MTKHGYKYLDKRQFYIAVDPDTAAATLIRKFGMPFASQVAAAILRIERSRQSSPAHVQPS